MSEPPEPSAAPGWIDLHAHTNESDGSLTPQELVSLAKQVGLDALAITDHDTFAGYEKAVPFAREAELDLVRGIELNSKLNMANTREQRDVHVLAYFPSRQPSLRFSAWLEEQVADRRNRNRRLAEALQSRGIDITVDEVEARGRSLAGRPHFARILVEKGYATSSDDAFRRYLGERAPSYVQRHSGTTEEVIQMIRSGDGIAVIAHPGRLSLTRDLERELLIRFKGAGLSGLEVYHSEHPAPLQAYYRQLAQELGLLPTGGSDFHGTAKPDVRLGSGVEGNVRVPREFLQRMRAAASEPPPGVP